MKPEDATSDQEVFQQLGAPARAMGTAAMLAAEQKAYRSRAQSQDSADADRRQTQEMRSRQAAERSMAKAELESVFQDGWIDHADAAEISRCAALAGTYAGQDERIDQAARSISQQVNDRYGIDVGRYPDEASLKRAMEAAERDLSAAKLLDGSRQSALDEQANSLHKADMADAALNQDPGREEEHELREEREKDLEQAGAAGQEADELEAAAERLQDAGMDEDLAQDTLRVEATHTVDANTAVETSKERQSSGQGRSRNRSRRHARTRTRTRSRGVSR